MLWGERLLQARNIVWVKRFFYVRLMCTFLGWARRGRAAGAGTIPGSGQAPALAESCCERDYSAPRREQHCCCLRGNRGVFLSQHKLPELLLHQLKAGPGPCLPLHKRRHFWYILMASEVTEFPLMSCLSVEGCLATLNHLFFHSSNRVKFSLWINPPHLISSQGGTDLQKCSQLTPSAAVGAPIGYQMGSS